MPTAFFNRHFQSFFHAFSLACPCAKRYDEYGFSYEEPPSNACQGKNRTLYNHSMDIYVGNLAYATTEEELQGLFSQYGAVAEARVVKDRVTGRSKGFGFVEMPNADEAKAAIEAINGIEFGGRPLRVNESRPREERPIRRARPENGTSW